jgi:hypothetical protein
LRVLNVKSQERQLGGDRLMQEHKNKMALKVIRYEDVDWINLAQDRVQWRTRRNTETKLRVPQNAGDILTS